MGQLVIAVAVAMACVSVFAATMPVLLNHIF